MENNKSKSKSKTAGKAKKAEPALKAVRTKKVKAVDTVYSEDEIRRKAQEIFAERSARGEHGTPEEDWHKAERLLKG